MKRTFIAAAAATVLAAALSIPVIAQPAGRRGPGPGGFGGPFPVLRGLDLTEAQREQIRTMTRERREAADAPGRKVADLTRQLHLAVLADTPDPQKLDELKGALAAALAEGLDHRLDVQTRIAQVLTPEQRAKARERLAAAPQPRRGGARRGRGL